MVTLDYQHRDNRRRDAWAQFRRSVFGPSRADVWGAFARQVGGTYVPGRWLASQKVLLTIGDCWPAVLDVHHVSAGESSESYTRLRCVFSSRNGFHFSVQRSNLLTPVARWMGFQNIDIGDNAFDESFVLKSNSPAQVRRLLADQSLRRRISTTLPRGKLAVEAFRKAPRHGSHRIDELRLETRGVIKDIARLQRWVETFSAVMTTLVAERVAETRDPLVRL